MPKITLGKPPKTWNLDVKFTMLDGTEGVIPCTFKYRTRRQYGEFIDSMTRAAGEAARKAAENARRAAAERAAEDASATSDDVANAAAAADVTLEAFFSRAIEQNVEFLLGVLDGWGLDIEFTREGLDQLCNEIPGGAAAVMAAYRAGSVEGRLGN